MQIKEVELKTGINANTLRYYEEVGLIVPMRNVENGYREYSEKDVLLLNKIKFLRNLQMPIKTVTQVFDNTLSLSDAITQTLHDLRIQKESLDLSINLLEILEQENRVSSDIYTNRIFDFSDTPHPFINFADYFSNLLSRHLPYLRMGFFPEEGINTKEDFVLELIQYARREDKKLEILNDSMMPLIRLNNVEMQAVLVASGYGLNYKFVKFKVSKSKY